MYGMWAETTQNRSKFIFAALVLTKERWSQFWAKLDQYINMGSL
jgi:hypothetical protein